MKQFMIAALILLANSALSQAQVIGSLKPIETRSGTLTFKLKDVGEPASSPYQLSVFLKCKDHRSTPTREQPKRHLIYFISLCDWRAYTTDLATEDAWLHYSQSEPDAAGESQCSAAMQKRYNIEELCEKWH